MLACRAIARPMSLHRANMSNPELGGTANANCSDSGRSSAPSSLLGVQGASAQDAAKYPEQTVRMVVPFSAGSMTDLLARVISESLAQRWKQQVIVENRPGLAGTSSVAKGTADGYTLMLTSNGHTVIGHLNKNLAFDPLKDFIGVSMVAITPLILTVPARLASQDAEGPDRTSPGPSPAISTTAPQGSAARRVSPAIC